MGCQKEAEESEEEPELESDSDQEDISFSNQHAGIRMQLSQAINRLQEQ